MIESKRLAREPTPGPGQGFAPLRFGQQAGDEVAVLQARQRPDAVPVELWSEALQVGDFMSIARMAA